MSEVSNPVGVSLSTVGENRDVETASPNENEHEEVKEKESRGMVDQVIVVWKAVKAGVKKAYSHTAVPSFLVPTRDAVREYLDDRFECVRNGSSVETEFFAGLLNFFSCMYILAVIPIQMGTAGYSAEKSAAIISLLTGLSSIVCGLVTNLPLITAPTTAISIYFVSNIRQFNLSTHEGNLAVSYAGVIIILLGIIGPLGRLISKLIPEYIQYAITIGIGLMTALSGLIEIDLVVRGRYTLLAVGTITPEIVLAISGLILISIGVYYHSKVSYVMGLLWGTVIWWSSQHIWPTVWTETPTIETDMIGSTANGDCILLIFEIFLLTLLSMFGLAKALCDLADITPTDESIPRGRLLMIVVGVSNLISGMFYGPPIIISPECSSGIKAGSKTGLSSVVAGVLFIISAFFAPLFSAIPAAGTTPVLIMIGMLLFQNISRIDFSSKYGMPAFICLIIIPFTDSIIGGISFGYVTFVIIAILTGDFTKQCQIFINYYCSGTAPLEPESSDGMTFDGPSLALTGVTASPGSAKRKRRQVGESTHGTSPPGTTIAAAEGSTQNAAAVSSAIAGQSDPANPELRNRSGSSSSVDSGGNAAAGPAGRGRSGTIDGAKVLLRRASAAFIESVTSEVNFKNDIKGTVLRYDHDV